jgi:Txe/YoeB family toxin of toxin-antitoxin system
MRYIGGRGYKMANLNIRVDDALKNHVEEILDNIGMSLSTATIIFLKQVVRYNGIPFDGIGKPEPLKHEFSGYWSRRIDDFSRIVYRVKDNRIEIIQCGAHYRDTPPKEYK